MIRQIKDVIFLYPDGNCFASDCHLIEGMFQDIFLNAVAPGNKKEVS